MTAAVRARRPSIYPAIRERLGADPRQPRHPATAPAPASCAAATPASARTSPTPRSPTASSTFLPSIGMTNAEAITNVTAFAAEVCGIADRTGTLEPGKDADILAVAGNPLDDITAIHHVVAVYVEGPGADSDPRQAGQHRIRSAPRRGADRRTPTGTRSGDRARSQRRKTTALHFVVERAESAVVRVATKKVTSTECGVLGQAMSSTA